MQECFRKYPEIYGAELEDDEREEGTATPEVAATERTSSSEDTSSSPADTVTPKPISTTSEPETHVVDAGEPKQVLRKEEEEVKSVIPRNAMDATDAGKGQK
jgi:intermembrane space import and assembly protein 40